MQPSTIATSHISGQGNRISPVCLSVCLSGFARRNMQSSYMDFYAVRERAGILSVKFKHPRDVFRGIIFPKIKLPFGEYYKTEEDTNMGC